MLKILFTQDPKVDYLFCGASFRSEPSLFFSNYLSGMGFKPVPDEFQHNFAGMTDEADNNSYIWAVSCRIVLEVRCKIQTLVHKVAYIKIAFLF